MQFKKWKISTEDELLTKEVKDHFANFKEEIKEGGKSKKNRDDNNKKKDNYIKTKVKEVKLFDSDINYSNDGNYLTNTCLSFNEKSRQAKETFTPEESHFQAVHYIQLIKKNDKKFG